VKIGKKKYNRGRNVQGQWLIGMIEILSENDRRGGAFRLEICPDNKRDAATLISLIKKTHGTWLYHHDRFMERLFWT
jgi:hypothetical protein